MDIQLLEDIGLTESEAKVYLALLELGSSSTGPIVDKAGVASSKIYDLLEKLIQKGLASFVIKSGVKHFEAAPPKRILDYMHGRQKHLMEQEKQLQQLIPELELKQQMVEKKSETLVFKGMKGAETAFQDILTTCSKKDELLVLGFSDIQETFQRFIVHFHKKRAAKGIKLRGMFGEELQWMREEISRNKFSQIKPLHGEKNPVAILIYHDKVLFSIARDLLWIQVKNKGLADSMRLRFETLWSQDVQVVKGIKEAQTAWDNMLDELEPGDEYYVLGASWMGQKKQVFDYFVDFHKRRTEKKVKVKFLFTAGTEKLLREQKDYHTLSEIKYLPETIYEGMQINLYKNKVLMFVWREKEPIIFTIEDKTVYKTFKTYFDSMWNKDTYILHGLDAVGQVFDEMLECGHCDLIGARGYFVDARPNFIDNWEKRAKAKGFTMRNVVDKDSKGHRITQFAFAETKYTLPKEFSFLSVFWIFGDKVVISNWVGNEPIVMVIKNKRLHDTYQKQFDTLWCKGL
jgi:HTH-type transcriptional regulator, sugar sensing transcriptional regulator